MGIFGTNIGQSTGSYNLPNTGGQPQAPAYVGATNPDGTLKTGFAMPDSSAWQTLAQGANTQQTNNNVSAAQAQANTGTQGAWSQLAQNGGLDSGARERLAMGGQKNALMAAQGARQAGATNAANIGITGQQMNLSADQTNIGTQMQNLYGQNAANRFTYDEANKNYMGQWDAQNAFNQANANQSSTWGKMLDPLQIGPHF